MNNAFELLSDDQSKVTHYNLRSNMMDKVVSELNQMNLTQIESAKFLGVTQPRISDLKNGRISKFSLDSLTMMLIKLNFKIEVNKVI